MPGYNKRSRSPSAAPENQRHKLSKTSQPKSGHVSTSRSRQDRDRDDDRKRSEYDTRPSGYSSSRTEDRHRTKQSRSGGKDQKSHGLLPPGNKLDEAQILQFLRTPDGLKELLKIIRALPILDQQLNRIQYSMQLLEKTARMPAHAENIITALITTFDDLAKGTLPEQFPRYVSTLLHRTAKLVSRPQRSCRLHSDNHGPIYALVIRLHEKRSEASSQHIANSLWAVGKLVEFVRDFTPTTELLMAIEGLLIGLNGKRGGANSQEIANSLWTVGKLVEFVRGFKPPAGMLAASQDLLIRLDAQRSPAVTPQGISITLWAMGKLAESVEDFTLRQKTLAAIESLLSRLHTQSRRAQSQNIANSLWAVGKLVEFVQGFTLTAEFLQSIEGLLIDLNGKRGEANSQDIANSLWAVGKALELNRDYKPTGQPLRAIQDLLIRLHESRAAKPQEIAISLWAMGKLFESNAYFTEITQLLTAIEGLLIALDEKRDAANPQHIANSLWAMGKVLESNRGYKPTRSALIAMQSLLIRLHAQCRAAKPQEIANSLWAAGKMVEFISGFTPTAEFLQPIEGLLIALNEKRNAANPQHIANSLWAATKVVESVPGFTPKQETLTAIQGLLIALHEKHYAIGPQHTGASLWAVGRLVESVRDFTLTQEALAAVHGLLIRLHRKRNKANLQTIANSLWAMGKLIEVGQYKENGLTEELCQSLEESLSRDSSISRADRIKTVHQVAQAYCYMQKPIPAPWKVLLDQEKHQPNDIQNELCKQISGLQPPEVLIGAWHVDLCLEKEKVIVELDGPKHYDNYGELMPTDQSRDRWLLAEGYRILRIVHYPKTDVPTIKKEIEKFVSSKVPHQISKGETDQGLVLRRHQLSLKPKPIHDPKAEVAELHDIPDLKMARRLPYPARPEAVAAPSASSSNLQAPGTLGIFGSTDRTPALMPKSSSEPSIISSQTLAAQ